MLNPSLARFIASPCRRQPFIYSLASPLSILVWLPVLCHHLFFTTLSYIFTSFPQSSNVFYSVLYSPTCFPYFLNLPLSSTVLYILLQFLYSLFYLPPSCILYNLIHTFVLPLSLTIGNFNHPFQRLQYLLAPFWYFSSHYPYSSLSYQHYSLSFIVLPHPLLPSASLGALPWGRRPSELNYRPTFLLFILFHSSMPFNLGLTWKGK